MGTLIAQMAKKQAVFCLCKENQLQEEYKPEIHPSKLKMNPTGTGLFYLVVAWGSFPPPSIKFDPDILEH